MPEELHDEVLSVEEAMRDVSTRLLRLTGLMVERISSNVTSTTHELRTFSGGSV
jgi:hypothetical protein